MIHQRLASASLAAAVALGAAACGAASSQTTQANAGSAVTQETTSGTAAQNASSAAAQSASSPAAQANSAFPYSPGGVTFTGDGGAVYEFSVPQAVYSQNTQAAYDAANDPDGSGTCMFSGELDYLSGSGWSVPVGVTIPIQAAVPIDGPVSTVTWAAGDYRLYIYGTTTCSWSWQLAP
jgi:hypothetical protein